MSPPTPDTCPDHPLVYQIRLEGQLGFQWADWFGGLTLSLEDSGEMLLTGLVADQAALYGLLKRVRDLGLPLISVVRVELNQEDLSEKYPQGRFDQNCRFTIQGESTMNRTNLLIEADELLQIIDDENVCIFDASLMDDMYLREHIPGAMFFDHEKFSDPSGKYMATVLPENELAAQIGAIGISNDSEVIVYACGMLPYAARAWWLLHYAGHENVRILNGGLSAWKKVGGPVEQDVRCYALANFNVRVNPDMFASIEEVAASLEDKNVAIVNVLTPASYAGKHIPGSINLGCLDLMDGDFAHGMDYFQPAAQLAQRFEEVAKHKRIITYCGGGIAAAVNAVVYWMNGHENVAVYNGSMYEWLGEGMPVNGTGNWEVWK